MTDPSTTQAAADRLGPLADSLEDAVLPACVRDAGGRYVAVNGAFADLVGLEAARLVGKTDNALQPADVAHRVAELDALVLEAHGHLDANETVLARDGRRTVRACRFPVYSDGEAWGVCVVMAPGDDPDAGRVAREELQASVGQIATSGVTAPSEQLVAERERSKAADAEAFAAREALAVEREARLEAELQARTASERLAGTEQRIEQLAAEIARLENEHDAASARAAELDATLGATGSHQEQLDAELAAARERAEQAEARIAELEAAGGASGDAERDLESLRAAYADLQAAGEEAEAARERYGDDLAKALAEQQELQRLLDDAIASREETQRELAGLREHFDRADRQLTEERERAEWLSVELQAAQHRERDADEAAENAELRRRQLEHALDSSNEKVETLTAELLALQTTADVSDETFAELQNARDRAERAEAALAEARSHGATLSQQLAVAQEALAAADQRLADELARAGEERRELDERAGATIEQLAAAQERAEDAELRAQAAETRAAQADERAVAAEQLRWELEQELVERRHATQAAEGEQLAIAEHRAVEAEGLTRAAEARAVTAEGMLAELEARAAAADRARAEAEEALALAAGTTHAEVAVLREELARAHATIDELRAALAIAEAERDVARTQPAEPAAAPTVAPPVAPVAGGLPPLSVAAEQARQFAHAEAPMDAAPPPGLTDELLADFDDALARASSVRSAGKALLQTLGTATGWIGGVLWEPKDEERRVFTCAETWVAYGAELQAWETMAWRAHLEDGLVPAAAGSGAAHWADTEEMLACPRSRSADWADLGTLVTVPVRNAEGETLAVLELVKPEREAEADEPLLGSFMSLAGQLAGRLAEIAGATPERAPSGRM